MSLETIDPIAEELIAHPGRAYIGYLTEVVGQKKAKTYLEIGTNTGDSLSPITCSSIAIDPNFRLDQEVVGVKPSCYLFQQTSDDFFAQNNPTQIFNRTIDVAFLDGMHYYEFLLRDFMNTEKHCEPDSLIILHDCLPPTYEMTNREFKAAQLNPKYVNYWAGDVWKVLPILQELRPDLKIAYFDCPPTGLAFITNLNPKSTVLWDRYDEVVEKWKPAQNDLAKLKDFLKTIPVASSHDVGPSEVESFVRQV